MFNHEVFMALGGKMRKIAVNICISLLSIIFTLFLAEVMARIYNAIVPVQATSWKEFREAKPAPYENTPIDLKEFMAEGSKIGWVTNSDYGFIPKDIAGKYYNIQNGYRKTSSNSSVARRRIWIFGGSTVFAGEVPDYLTMPGYLAKLTKATFGSEYEVINAGATTITIRHQVYRLIEMANIQKGDLVIFMDGVNDVIQTLYFQNPTGTMIQYNRDQILSAGILAKYLLLLHENTSSYSVFIRRFLNPVKPSYIFVKTTPDLITQLGENYFSSIQKADAYVRSRGGNFYHFLQPNLFTVSNLTSYEQKLLTNGYLIAPPLAVLYGEGYPVLKAQVSKAKSLGILSFDISNAFDKRSSEIFFDFCHVNERGNELLANAIFSIVKADPLLNTK